MTRLVTQLTPRKQSISLVLGSGGARGIAHIGVIQCLQEFGYHINAISGCSMGAVVGGIFAAGKLKDYELWLRKLTKAQVLSLLDFSFTNKGLVKGNKIVKTLKDIVGDKNIEDLSIPFTAVATDIINVKEIWLDQGPLFKAVRASMALPLFFTPFISEGRVLIDGGVLNPVPIAPTFKHDSDLTIAVNLCGPADDRLDQELSVPPSKFLLANFFTRKPSATTALNELDGYDITGRALEAMQMTIARQKLAAYPPDLIIDIPRNICKTMEFHRANELIEVGYKRAFSLLKAFHVS